MRIEDHQIKPYTEIIFAVPSPLDADGLDSRLVVPQLTRQDGTIQLDGIIPCRVLPGYNRMGTQPQDILPSTEALIPGVIGLRGLGRPENTRRFCVVDHTEPSEDPKPLFDNQGNFLPENLNPYDPVESRKSLTFDHALLEIVHFAEAPQGIVPQSIGRVAVVCGSYFGPGSELYGDIFTSAE